MSVYLRYYSFQVVAGVAQTARSFGSFRQVYAVENIIVHPHYDEFTNANDIGIVGLKNKIVFGPEMDVIQINWNTTDLYGKENLKEPHPCHSHIQIN